MRKLIILLCASILVPACTFADGMVHLQDPTTGSNDVKIIIGVPTQAQLKAGLSTVETLAQSAYDLALAGSKEFFLSTNVSAFAETNLMLATQNPVTATNTYAGVTNDQYFAAWITPTNQPALTIIKKNSMRVTVYAAVESDAPAVASAQFNPEVYRVTSGGVFIEEYDSVAVSTVLGTVFTKYVFEISTIEDKTIDMTDRLIVKVKGVIGGVNAGSDPTILILTGDGYASGITMTLSPVDVPTVSELALKANLNFDNLNAAGTNVIENIAGTLAVESYVYVGLGSSEAENGTNFKTAYSNACLLTPYENPISVSNRVVVILQPAIYDIGSIETNTAIQLQDYVDIAAQVPSLGGIPVFKTTGLYEVDDDPVESVRQYPNALIRGSGFRLFEFSGTNIKLHGFGIENIGHSGIDGRTIYYSNNNGPENSFFSMMYFSEIRESGKSSWTSNPDFKKDVSGMWVDCITASDKAWRVGYVDTYNSTCHVYMVNCVAGYKSFAGDSESYPVQDEIISGSTFINCTGEDQSFGGCAGWGLPADSTTLFKNCTAGARSFSIGSDSAATLLNCRGGDNCVSSSTSGGTYYGNFSGYAENCVFGADSFGGGGYGSKLTGKLVNCVISSNKATYNVDNAELINCDISCIATNTDTIRLISNGSSVISSRVYVEGSGTGIPISSTNAVSATISDCVFNNLDNDSDGIGADVTNIGQESYTKEEAQLVFQPIETNTVYSTSDSFVNGTNLQLAVNAIQTGGTVDVRAGSYTVDLVISGKVVNVVCLQSPELKWRIPFPYNDVGLTITPEAPFTFPAATITGSVTITTNALMSSLKGFKIIGDVSVPYGGVGSTDTLTPVMLSDNWVIGNVSSNETTCVYLNRVFVNGGVACGTNGVWGGDADHTFVLDDGSFYSIQNAEGKGGYAEYKTLKNCWVAGSGGFWIPGENTTRTRLVDCIVNSEGKFTSDAGGVGSVIADRCVFYGGTNGWSGISDAAQTTSSGSRFTYTRGVPSDVTNKTSVLFIYSTDENDIPIE